MADRILRILSSSPASRQSTRSIRETQKAPLYRVLFDLCYIVRIKLSRKFNAFGGHVIRDYDSSNACNPRAAVSPFELSAGPGNVVRKSLNFV